MSRPAAYVNLTTDDRKKLEKMTRSGEIKARVYNRAKILLMADRKQSKWSSQAQIVEATGASSATVSVTCRRYAEQGLEAALSEKPRPGAPPKVTGEVEANLVMLACSEPPAEQVRWTLGLLRDELIRLEAVESVSKTAIANKLKKMNLSLGE
jgi:putative transposase